MRQLLIGLLVLTTTALFSQSTTYNNNYGTNYIRGITGSFNKSSISWTITQKNNSYDIKTSATGESFNVSYAYYDQINKLYVYKPNGNEKFDGSRVKLVMTNGKLSNYSKGIIKKDNILGILFIDDTGYMYNLNK